MQNSLLLFILFSVSITSAVNVTITPIANVTSITTTQKSSGNFVLGLVIVIVVVVVVVGVITGICVWHCKHSTSPVKDSLIFMCCIVAVVMRVSRHHSHCHRNHSHTYSYPYPVINGLYGGGDNVQPSKESII